MARGTISASKMGSRIDTHRAISAVTACTVRELARARDAGRRDASRFSARTMATLATATIAKEAPVTMAAVHDPLFSRYRYKITANAPAANIVAKIGRASWRAR